jgi:hypothetical protein
MTQIHSGVDRHRLQTLCVVSGSGIALRTHAIAPGASESNLDSQLTVALAYWQAQQTAHSANGYAELKDVAPGVDTAVADAVAKLTAERAYIRNPAGNLPPQW